jgi:lysylphosphatidylglycerol synthetase-like protein (DUF2156 family)
MTKAKEMSRSEIAECIKRWGCSASIALFDPACKIFTLPNTEGLIGYHIESSCIVVFGDPVCPPGSTFKLTEGFHQFCHDHGKSVIYLTASERFSQWAMEHVCHALLEVEEELILDPSSYPKTGSNGRLLHKKMNHAIHAHVSVKEYLGQDEKIEKAIEKAGSEWLNARKGPQIFLSHASVFEDRIGRRWFYAEQGDKIVGALLLNRLDIRQGWLLYLLMVMPDAPGGTSEYLILSALDMLAAEQCHSFSFGASAAEQLGQIVGLDKFSSWIARTIFKASKRIFHLDNRRKFWKKFEPHNERSFILFSKPRIGIKEILAVMRTLNASF